MSVTVYFKNSSKRRNSTLQTSFSASDAYSCVLKDATSLDRPTFLVSAATMDFNVAKWDNRYYFIDDVVSVRNNQWEVSCVLDVLATYKSDITGSTQFVSYSASTTGDATWLSDTRIPVTKKTEIGYEYDNLNTLFDTTGFYVLSVVGSAGCELYAVTEQNLIDLIGQLQTWQNDGITGIINDDLGVIYDFSSIETAIESLGKMSIQTGFIGNAYSQAPACIRSCIWVPFLLAAFQTGAAKNIFLGTFDTGVQGTPIKSTPATGFKAINIPWFHTDWRRAYCETIYVFLPLVGIIQIPSDSVTNASGIIIDYSATATDGCVSYSVSAGGQIVGTYGGQCSSNYPIGINQQSSAGEIAQSVMAGADKMVSTAVNSTISPISMAAVAGAVALEGVNAAYQTADVAASTHMSCIGGIGGGSGAGLARYVACYVVNHETIVTPSAMAATMGRPVMKPMSLSGLSGYCQCANAHVSATAQARELDAIDYYLNSGFFIE